MTTNTAVLHENPAIATGDSPGATSTPADLGAPERREQNEPESDARGSSLTPYERESVIKIAQAVRPPKREMSEARREAAQRGIEAMRAAREAKAGEQA